MAILVDRDTRILIQGITGSNGRNAAGRMLEGGSPLVGGVTPGRGGRAVCGLPVFDTCREAVAATGAEASFVSVPAARALEAAREALEAGIALVVVYTEGVPVLDAVRIVHLARRHRATVLGPNSAGCASPGLANLSDLNDAYLRPGRIGICSKSGTLTYEVIDGLAGAGLGVSTVVCLGGDPVVGCGHAEILDRFARDRQTDAVVLIGELGGRSEIRAAERVAVLGKPVVAFLAGRHAPPGKRMGHAGALLGAAEENVPAKERALAAAGARIARSLAEIPALLGPGPAR